MKKNLFSKALAVLLSAGLMGSMLPVSAASAEVTTEVHTENVTAAEASTETTPAAVTTTAYDPAETFVTTTSPVDYNTGTFTTTVTTVTSSTQQPQTTLRTTRTMLEDEMELSCTADEFTEGAWVNFGQSLENVFSLLIDFPEISDASDCETRLVFSIYIDEEPYDVMYPLSIYSYDSKDGCYAFLYPENSFSYAEVRSGDFEDTVSLLDMFDPELADLLLAKVKASEGAYLEITGMPLPAGTSTTYDSSTGTYTETTTVPAYGHYVYQGGAITVPVFYEEISGSAEEISVEGGNTVIDITDVEYFDELINIHITGISEGSDNIRIVCSDGSVITIPVTVLSPETTTTQTSSTTTSTTYLSSTAPTTSYYTTTISYLTSTTPTTSDDIAMTTLQTTEETPYYVDFPEVHAGDFLEIEHSFDIPCEDIAFAPPSVQINDESVLRVESDMEDITEIVSDNVFKVKLLGLKPGTTDITIKLYGQDFRYQVTVWDALGGTYAVGDVNADGTADISDATLVLTVYAMQAAGIPLEEYSGINADIDRDGVVSVNDATNILSFYAQNAAGLAPAP